MFEKRKNRNYTLTYGQDHLDGLFFKIESYDGVVMEEDSKSVNPQLTIGYIASVAEDYGFNLSNELEEEEIDYDEE